MYLRKLTEIPFNGLRWWFDHAETISDRSMERVKALNGGIAIQDRMAFQGEYFVDLYGKEAAAYSSDLSYVRPLVYLLAPVVMQPGFPAITLGLLFTGWLLENHWWAFHIR